MSSSDSLYMFTNFEINNRCLLKGSIRKIMLEVLDSTYNQLFVRVSQGLFVLSCFPKQSDILSKPLFFLYQRFH